MALQTFVGAFNIGTGSGSLSVTGVGFQGACAIFWWTGQTSSTNRVGDGVTGAGSRLVKGMGFAIGTTPSTDQRAVSSSSVDGSANADTGSCAIAGVICTDDGGPSGGAAAFTGKATLSSFDSDGFTLNRTDAFPTDMRVGFMILGGSDLTDMAIEDISEPAATGTQSYVLSPAFQPDFLLFVGHQLTGAVDVATAQDSGLMIGWAKGTAAGDQGVCVGNSDDGVSTMDTDGYALSGECIAHITIAGGNPNARAAVNAINSDGFDLNWIARATTNRKVYALALKGPLFAVGELSSSVTLNADLAASGFGFQPSAAMFVGHGQVESTAGTSQGGDRMSIGAFDENSNEHCQVFHDRNGLGNANIDAILRTDAVWADIGATAVVDALAGLQSIDSDGFTLNQDDAAGAASRIGYWSIGPAAASSSAALSGHAGTGSAGTLSASASVALSGQGGTGTAGTLAAGAARSLTGQAGTGSAGTVAASVSLALSGEVGTGAIGTLTPTVAGVEVALTGQAGTGSAGTLAASVSASLAGQSGTGTAGTPAAGVACALSGQAGTGAAGTLTPSVGGVEVPITGQAGTGSAGTLAPSASIALSGHAGTVTPGAFGVAVTRALQGTTSSGDVGALGPSVSAAIAGQEGTGLTGTYGVEVSLALTGMVGTGAAGALSLSWPFGNDLSFTDITVADPSTSGASVASRSSVATVADPSASTPEVT